MVEQNRPHPIARFQEWAGKTGPGAMVTALLWLVSAVALMQGIGASARLIIGIGAGLLSIFIGVWVNSCGDKLRKLHVATLQMEPLLEKHRLATDPMEIELRSARSRIAWMERCHAAMTLLLDNDPGLKVEDAHEWWAQKCGEVLDDAEASIKSVRIDIKMIVLTPTEEPKYIPARDEGGWVRRYGDPTEAYLKKQNAAVFLEVGLRQGIAAYQKLIDARQL